MGGELAVVKDRRIQCKRGNSTKEQVQKELCNPCKVTEDYLIGHAKPFRESLEAGTRSPWHSLPGTQGSD